MAKKVIRKSKLKSAALPLIAVFFNLALIMFPSETLGAARDGLDLWLKNVLPSLLPFLIGVNVISALGGASFLGGLLEPIMRPLFGVPGCGGFGLAVGMLSGYPLGAKTTAALMENDGLSKTEAERLLSFASNSGPLFVVGAVGAGMFESPAVGYFLLLVIYLSSLTTGLLFRFYKKGRGGALTRAKKSAPKAVKAGGFGAVLGESVGKAVETLLLIGGYIILFGVIVKILDVTNFFALMETLLAPAGDFFRLPREIYRGVIAGFIEITSGVRILAQGGAAKASVICAAAVISWGGLSIHAQALGFFKTGQINPLVYFAAKLINALLAAFYALSLYSVFEGRLEGAAARPVFDVFGGGVIGVFVDSALMFTGGFVGLCLIGAATAALKGKRRLRRR